MNKTTIYLIRHSVRMKNELIENYVSKDSDLTKYEKIILSVSGEERAKLLSEKEELQNLDKIYTSNCVRTLQTAKYFIYKQNLKANIDERLDERRVGKPNSDEYPDWFEKQYLDENFKTVGGESQIEVRKRMLDILNEILEKDKGKKVAVFSHGLAITFLLLNYLKLEKIENRNITLCYKGKIILNGRINSPEVFKLIFDDKKLEDISLIKFDDIPYEDFN